MQLFFYGRQDNIYYYTVDKCAALELNKPLRGALDRRDKKKVHNIRQLIGTDNGYKAGCSIRLMPSYLAITHGVAFDADLLKLCADIIDYNRKYILREDMELLLGDEDKVGRALKLSGLDGVALIAEYTLPSEDRLWLH